jgi:hypothetical protein
MTKFVKKRIGDEAIVVVDANIYRRQHITDDDWDTILEYIDRIEYLEQEIKHVEKEDFSRPEELNALRAEKDSEMDDFLDFLVPERVEEQEQIAFRLSDFFIREKELEEQKYVYNLADMEADQRHELSDMLLEDFSDEFRKNDEGYVYMKGFNTPLPKQLIENLMDAHNSPEEAMYTEKSLINFWKWLMVNPDRYVRTDLFKWISTGQWSITDEGMIISYRNVAIMNDGCEKQLQEFITEQYTKVKRWKKSPKNFSVAQAGGNYYCMSNDKAEERYNVIGNLQELYETVVKGPEQVVYTDNFSRTMEIKIGEPVSMPRKECDNDPNSACSRGLHQMSKAYGLRMGETTLVCLVNPYNVVAVPRGEHSKFRTCEYLPIGLAEKDENGDLVEWEGGTYGLDYPGYTEDKLNDLFSNNQVEILKEAGIISDEMDDDVDFKSIFEGRNIKVDE